MAAPPVTEVAEARDEFDVGAVYDRAQSANGEFVRGNRPRLHRLRERLRLRKCFYRALVLEFSRLAIHVANS